MVHIPYYLIEAVGLYLSLLRLWVLQVFLKALYKTSFEPMDEPRPSPLLYSKSNYSEFPNDFPYGSEKKQNSESKSTWA